MMGVSSVLMRIRKYFFRKTTMIEFRLTWLKIYVVRALFKFLVLNMRFLNRILMAYGAPQLPEKDLDLELNERSKEPMHISDLKPDYTKAVDLRDKDNPTHVCICGSMLWDVKCMFQDYEISMYFTDMECAECGSKATAPTLVDMPEDYVMMDDRPKEEYYEED